MASTITQSEDLGIGGTEHLYIVNVAVGVYATSGVALDLAANRTIRRLLLQPTGGYVFQWVPSTQLLKVYVQKDPGNAGGADIPLVEVANGVDLSTPLADVQGIAIGS